MSIFDKYANGYRKLLPTPFSIAIILSIITIIAALIVSPKSPSTLLLDWQTGLWNSNLLAFAFQMMLMLVLGHALALSRFFDKTILVLIKPIRTTAQAAALVTFSTIIVAMFNWGLGLVFGAIIARKIGESFTQKELPLNYPLIGAAGYVGLMVWHGGLSGSALAKVAERGHMRLIAHDSSLPDVITYSETVFSSMNIVAFVLLITVIPVVFYVIGKSTSVQVPQITTNFQSIAKINRPEGAELIDHLSWISKSIGVLLLTLSAYIAYRYDGPSLGFITPNFINFVMLAMCLLLHQNFHSFLHAIDDAIHGASGILIQFPLYFGILAMMQSGGLIEIISDWFIIHSNETTLPLFTFISAGIVNIFVPSGGGQWAIQGPILLEAAGHLGVPLHKMILAMAYGDQLTNMLQPFWALPLLSITGLQAKDILPYTIVLMCIGLIIFGSILFLF